jgi:hypothetical protein
MTNLTPTDRMTAEQSDVVLFGLDETGKPRAARFSGEHTDLAARAAGLMSLSICCVNSAELATIAQQLPVGRIHANGRGLVPNVRRDLYDKLIEATRSAAKTDSDNQGTGKPADNPTEISAPNSDPASPAPNTAQGYPRDWDDINSGMMLMPVGGKPSSLTGPAIWSRCDGAITQAIRSSSNIERLSRC